MLDSMQSFINVSETNFEHSLKSTDISKTIPDSVIFLYSLGLELLEFREVAFQGRLLLGPT